MATVNSFDQYDANMFLDGMGTTPVLFAQNVINQSTQTNNFINSGIVMDDPQMASQLLLPGEEAVLPFTNDLYGEPQPWSDNTNINVNPITADHERAVKLRQSQAFGFTDVAQLKQMGNPLNVITSRLANYWRRQDENILLKTLEGTFKNPTIQKYNVFDQDQAQPFNVTSFERAVSLLADYQDDTFTAIAVHPAVYAQMKAQNYINLTGNDTPQSRAVTPFGTYNGMNVVVDRRLPVDENGVATSYIFAAGAVMFSVATPANGVETWRHPGEHGGQTQIFSKRVYTAHVHGTTVADGYTPLSNNGYSYDDLVNPAMWDLVKDPLHVHVVAYKSTIEAGFQKQFFDDEADGEASNAAAGQTTPATEQTITKGRSKKSSASSSASTSTTASSSAGSSSASK